MMIFIQRILIPFVSILAVVFLFFKGLSGQNNLLLGLLGAFPVLCFLARRPVIWFSAFMFSSLACLSLPGISQTLMISDVIIFGFLCFVFLPFLLGRFPFPSEFVLSRFFALLFIGVLLLHMLLNGTGLRALGGNVFGGMNYIRSILAAGTVLAAGSICATSSSWKTFVVVYTLGLIIPGIAQSVFLLSDGTIFQQYYFIRFDDTTLTESLRAEITGTNIVRYQALNATSLAILVFAMTLAPWNLMIPLLILSLPLVFLSGFRAGLASNLTLLFIFSLLHEQKHRIRMVLKYCLILLLLGFLVYPFSSQLPESAQRVLSMIPIYSISDIANNAAESSIQWRLEIWKMMLTNIPNHLWIGRGFAFNSDLFSSVDPLFLITPEYAYDTHNYHNGPLGILLDLGVGGLCCVLGFFFVACREAFRVRSRFSTNAAMRRVFTFFLAYLLLQVLVFLFAYGDIFSSIPNIMYTLAILIGLSQSVKSGMIHTDPETTAPLTTKEGIPS